MVATNQIFMVIAVILCGGLRDLAGTKANPGSRSVCGTLIFSSHSVFLVGDG